MLHVMDSQLISALFHERLHSFCDFMTNRMNIHGTSKKWYYISWNDTYFLLYFMNFHMISAIVWQLVWTFTELLRIDVHVHETHRSSAVIHDTSHYFCDVYDKFDNDPIKIWFIFSNSASNDSLLIDLKPTMILKLSRLFNESIS